jgi:hypothetical protein
MANFSHDEILNLLGTYVTPANHEDDEEELAAAVSVPSSFDARKQWSSCVHKIRD